MGLSVPQSGVCRLPTSGSPAQLNNSGVRALTRPPESNSLVRVPGNLPFSQDFQVIFKHTEVRKPPLHRLNCRATLRPNPRRAGLPPSHTGIFQTSLDPAALHPFHRDTPAPSHPQGQGEGNSERGPQKSGRLTRSKLSHPDIPPPIQKQPTTQGSSQQPDN